MKKKAITVNTSNVKTKLVEKEKKKLSKAEKKRISDLGWAGKGSLCAGHVFDGKGTKKDRPNIEHLYRSGKLD